MMILTESYAVPPFNQSLICIVHYFSFLNEYTQSVCAASSQVNQKLRPHTWIIACDRLSWNSRFSKFIAPTGPVGKSGGSYLWEQPLANTVWNYGTSNTLNMLYAKSPLLQWVRMERSVLSRGLPPPLLYEYRGHVLGLLVCISIQEAREYMLIYN